MSTRRTDTLLKPLDASEALFWLYNQATPFHFVIAGQFGGRTDIADWRRALDVVQAAHPILGCGIDVSTDARAVFVALGEPIPLRVLQGQNIDAWQTAFAAELFEPIAMRGCLLRAVLVHAPDRAVLILSFHHAIADGISAAHLLAEMLAVLSDRTLRPQAPAPTMRSPDGPASASARQRMMAPATVQSAKLSRQETEDVRAASRRNGATLHGTLAAALIQCGREVSPEWRADVVRLLSPINTRPLLGLPNDPMLAVAMAVTTVAPRRPSTFWEVARSVTSDVAHKRSAEAMKAVFSALDGFIASHPGPAEVQRFMVDTFTSEMMLSNLGSLSLTTAAGDLALEAIWGPGVMTGIDGEQVIGAATLNGELHMLHSSYSPLDMLLNKATQFLRNIG